MMLKFCVKESSMALKILGRQRFPLQPGWGGTPSINQKVTKSPPIRIPPPNFLHSPHESLTPPTIT